MTDQELLKYATEFQFPGGVKIKTSAPLSYSEGSWFIIKGGDRLLCRPGEWKLYNQVGDGSSFLFPSPKDAAEFFLAKGQS